MADWPESLVDAAESALRSAPRVSDFARVATVAVLRSLGERGCTILMSNREKIPDLWADELEAK